MTYSFRVPIWLPIDRRVNWPHETLDLSNVEGRHVYVKADLAEHIASASRLSLRGNGYATEAEALREGEAWLDSVSIALIDLMIGHDLRPEGPHSYFSEDALKSVTEADPHHQHFGERTGVFVFESDPPAVFYELTADGVGGLGGEDLLSKALAAHDAGARLDERLELARDLYGAAMFLAKDEARLIALVTAVESLIEQAMRPAAELEMLKKFVADLRGSDLDSGAKARLSSALNNLQRESIRSSGNQLAARVGEKTYLGMTPGAFWSHVYTLRSKMSHGRLSASTGQQLREASPAMQFYFRDLFLAIVRGE